MKRLIQLIITIITVITVYLTVKLTTFIFKKLKVREKMEALIEKYKETMSTLFEKVAEFFKR